MQPEPDLVLLRASFDRFVVEVLSEIERLLPGPEGEAMVNHHLVHIYIELLDGGPLFVHWTYVFERFMSSLVRNITDRSSMYCALYAPNCTHLSINVHI
jgi:hypothetical protein